MTASPVSRPEVVGNGPAPMVAVVVVRDGALPLGADEAVAEAGGHAVLAGSGTALAAAALSGPGDVRVAELGAFAPGAWSRALARTLAVHTVIVLPASPDGRDLAPRAGPRPGPAPAGRGGQRDRRAGGRRPPRRDGRRDP